MVEFKRAEDRPRGAGLEGHRVTGSPSALAAPVTIPLKHDGAQAARCGRDDVRDQALEFGRRDGAQACRLGLAYRLARRDDAPRLLVDVLVLEEAGDEHLLPSVIPACPPCGVKLGKGCLYLHDGRAVR